MLLVKPRQRTQTLDCSSVETMLSPRITYQLLFLRNDKRQTVYVDEVDTVDFDSVKKHLEHGESVFITSRTEQKLPT